MDELGQAPSGQLFRRVAEAHLAVRRRIVALGLAMVPAGACVGDGAVKVADQHHVAGPVGQVAQGGAGMPPHPDGDAVLPDEHQDPRGHGQHGRAAGDDQCEPGRRGARQPVDDDGERGDTRRERGDDGGHAAAGARARVRCRAIRIGRRGLGGRNCVGSRGGSAGRGLCGGAGSRFLPAVVPPDREEEARGQFARPWRHAQQERGGDERELLQDALVAGDPRANAQRVRAGDCEQGQVRQQRAPPGDGKHRQQRPEDGKVREWVQQVEQEGPRAASGVVVLRPERHDPAHDQQRDGGDIPIRQARQSPPRGAPASPSAASGRGDARTMMPTAVAPSASSGATSASESAPDDPRDPASASCMVSPAAQNRAAAASHRYPLATAGRCRPAPAHSATAAPAAARVARTVTVGPPRGSGATRAPSEAARWLERVPGRVIATRVPSLGGLSGYLVLSLTLRTRDHASVEEERPLGDK